MKKHNISIVPLLLLTEDGLEQPESFMKMIFSRTVPGRAASRRGMGEAVYMNEKEEKRGKPKEMIGKQSACWRLVSLYTTLQTIVSSVLLTSAALFIRFSCLIFDH